MGAVWSSGGALATAKRYLGGCGTQSAGLSFGGYDGASYSATTEEYAIPPASLVVFKSYRFYNIIVR